MHGIVRRISAIIRQRGRFPRCYFCDWRAFKMEQKRPPRAKTGGVLPLVCPKLMEQWDYEKNAGIDPMTLRRGSMKRVFWKCRNGHSWEDTVSHRVQERMPCPICGDPTLRLGESFAQKRPDLLRQWDANKNIPYHPNHISAESRERVWWRCGKGHNWTAPICARAIRNEGCPYCEGRQSTPGSENDPLDIQQNNINGGDTK